MSTLEEDIARVAALRGKSADFYNDAEAERRRARAVLNPHMLARLGEPNQRDLSTYDRLPEASRRFIRESNVPMNAFVWRDLLDQMPEAVLIEQLTVILKRMRLM